MNIFSYCTLATVVVSADLAAQQSVRIPIAARELQPYQDGAERGFVTLTEGHELYWMPGGYSSTELPVQLPFEQASTLAYLADGCFMVSGHDPAVSRGYLARVRRIGGVVIVDGLQSFPNRVFETMIYNSTDGTVFAVDTASREIVSIPIGSPWLPPTSAALQVVATHQEVSYLHSSSKFVELRIPADGASGLRVESGNFMSSHLNYLELQEIGGQWTVTEREEQFSGLTRWRFEDRISNGQNALGGTSVGGAIGSFVMVERFSGRVVASGSRTSVDYAPITTANLIPGAWYTLNSTSPGIGSTAACFAARWGAPKSGPDINVRYLDNVTECYSGNSSFAVSARAILQDPAGEDRTAEYFLWIGLDTGVPVLHLPDGSAVINTLIGTVGPLSVTSSEYKGAMYVPLPLPPEGGGLDYQTLLFQFVLISNGQPLYTDVVGAVMLPGSLLGEGAPAAQMTIQPGIAERVPDLSSVESPFSTNSFGAGIHQRLVRDAVR